MTSFDAAGRRARINAGLPDAPVMDALLSGDSDAAQPGGLAVNRARSNPEGKDDQAATDKRDLLGEMLIAAIMMITGGEQRDGAHGPRRPLSDLARHHPCGLARPREGLPLAHDVAIELMGMHKDATLSGARQIDAEKWAQSMMTSPRACAASCSNREGRTGRTPT